MEYVLLKMSFVGNDDANVEGFVAKPVESQKAWEKQIKNAIKADLDDSSGCMTIYHSDNDGTPFESVAEVWQTLKFKKITEDQFDALSKLFQGNKKSVEFGHVPSFLNYTPEAPAKKVSPK